MKNVFAVALFCVGMVSEVSALLMPTNLIDRTTGVGAVITSQQTNTPAIYGPDRLFDNQLSSKFMTSNAASWVQYQFGGGNHFTIVNYTMTSALDAPMGSSSNLVLNPSFESGGAAPTSWIKPSPYASGSTNTASDGSYALRLSVTNPVSVASTTQIIAIQPGVTYDISVWVNTTDQTGGTAVFDTGDKYDGPEQGQYTFNASTGGWVKRFGSFTATNTSLTLRMFANSSFNGTVYFDNISLTARVALGNPADMDPRSWTLSGSNDGTNWNIVDSRSAIVFTNRSQTRSFDVASPSAYEVYRIHAANNSGSFLQWAEMELLGYANENLDPYDYTWSTVVSGDPETTYGDDLDGDLRNNLYEYALGGDPENPLNQGFAPTFIQQPGRFVYTHRQRTNDLDLTYQIETCTHLPSGLWTNSGFSLLSTTPIDGEFNEMSYSIPKTSDPLYLRLKLSCPPMALARDILADTRLDAVVSMGNVLLASGLNAGTSYDEVWIRDLSTFIVPLLEMGPTNYAPVREALLTFFNHQGVDGNIPDGYTVVSTNVTTHKNTVETDQESCMVQAVCRYIQKTADTNILNEVVAGKSVRERLEMALEYPLTYRFSATYGLIWGATTSDWGDVQPEDSPGVLYNTNSHPAIDIYDNALMLVAIQEYLQVCCVGNPTQITKWTTQHTNLYTAVRDQLWDDTAQKFIPHIYLEKGSPFPTNFNENAIYYHGGTAVAIEARLLNRDEIAVSLQKMKDNVTAAGAATIGLTVYPPYPSGYFMNSSMVPWSYQNGGDWTWFGARMVRQLARNGYVAKAYDELKPMVDRVLANNGFYEWYTPGNQKRGSGQFRGEAGVLMEAIQELRTWASSNSISPVVSSVGGN